MSAFRIAGELHSVTEILRKIDPTVELPWERPDPFMCDSSYADMKDPYIVKVDALASYYFDSVNELRLKVVYDGINRSASVYADDHGELDFLPSSNMRHSVVGVTGPTGPTGPSDAPSRSQYFFGISGSTGPYGPIGATGPRGPDRVDWVVSEAIGPAIVNPRGRNEG